MFVWSHLSTIFNRRHALPAAALIAICVAITATLFFGAASHAAPGVNQTLSFQGRLLNSTGGVVPDGYYNMQFKIYQDGAGTAAANPGGTLKWTESYINNGGTSGVEVKNGYFSVNLGSNNPFGSSVDWNQDTLWLSMNVAGTSASCTTFGTGPCTADGEMLPMKRLTSTPFALNSAQLGGKTADGFIQNTTSAQTADFNVTGSGRANTLQGNTSVIAPLFDTNIAFGTLSIGTVDAAIVNIASGNFEQAINIGTGTGIKTVTIGSTHSISSTLIQGGTAGVRVETAGGFAVQNVQAGIDAFVVQSNGNVDVRLLTNSGFTVRRENNDPIFDVLESGIITATANSHLVANGLATFNQGITVQSGSLTYQTPNGYNMSTAINIPNYTVGAYSSVLAMGLPSSSAATARGILVADGRTVAHQATIGILSPDENAILGLSYNGSNSVGTLANTAASVALQGNGLDLLTATNNGGNANVGIGNDASAGYALDVTGDINTSTQLRIGGVATVTSSSLTFSAASTANISSAAGQSLNLDGKTGATIQTNGTTRATFDTSNTLFLGNGTASATPANFTVQATNSSATAVAGASLTIQGGNATTGNANGGSLILDAGAKFGSGSGGILTVGVANASSITIGNASSNIVTAVLGTAVFKPTTGNDSTTSFQLQRANGTAMLVADSVNQTISIGNVAGGNIMAISTSTGEVTYYGSARHTKKISLNPEYTGSVLDAGTGSSNTGTMTSSVDLTNRMNYYKWTTSQGSNQSYDVVVQVPLPADFDGWASSNPLSVSTYTSNTTNGTITLEARDSSGTVRCNFVSVTPGSTSTWTANNSACTLNTGTYTAGDYMTLRIRMQSPASGDVRVGNINLSYLSKY